jgi:hypothetical protein
MDSFQSDMFPLNPASDLPDFSGQDLLVLPAINDYAILQDSTPRRALKQQTTLTSTKLATSVPSVPSLPIPSLSPHRHVYARNVPSLVVQARARLGSACGPGPSPQHH